MSELVVHARDLKKVYRLYKSPRHRFLDMFGLLRESGGAYTEHAALGGVSLDIRRGEKVAFIGRNGAGKSTLLKLFTGVIEPTAGTLEVRGKAHALLQIGTGFHPDFSGRENVFAYLAQLGVTGREAENKYDEIVEFAELEEYIGQPVKTYSSGMAVRLMFATSTAITPDLLVLDEVLGVGDAYFAHKSYSRIRELCERDGTTLLLVTHDVYSAVSICERVVWIDHGSVMMDGEAATVVNAYENSIRLQEERRLRLKAERRSRELASDPADSQVVIEVAAADGAPQPCPVYFSRMDFVVNGARAGGLPLGRSTGKDSALQTEGVSWGETVAWEGREARPLLNFGSPFHKVAGTINVPYGLLTTDAEMAVELDYWSAEPCQLVVKAFVDGRQVLANGLPEVSSAWREHRAVTGERTSREPVRVAASSGRQGTGAIVVESVTPMNRDQHETYAFAHGEPFELQMAYRINQPGLRERAQVLVAFHRDGVHDVMRTIHRDFLFDEQHQPHGTIVLRFPRLPLANGTYSITVMVARESYYDEEQTEYFSINPGVYTCLTRLFDITVDRGGIVGSGTNVVADGDWSLRA